MNRKGFVLEVCLDGADGAVSYKDAVVLIDQQREIVLFDGAASFELDLDQDRAMLAVLEEMVGRLEVVDAE